jgi:cell division protein FtsQ
MGEALLFVRLEKLRERVEAIPGVERAVVARRMPDMIQVHVTERRAVARTRLGRVLVLVDREGYLFPPSENEEGLPELPLLQGLATAPGTIRLVERDLPALRALEALEEVTGREAPAGTTVDLSPLDKIVLRPGHDAPQLWLDRERPARNLQNFFELKGGVAELAPDRSVDLRFPHRLTVVMSQDVATRR